MCKVRAAGNDAASIPTARTLHISVDGQEVYSGTVEADGFSTISTAPIDWQPGVTEVTITADGEDVTPVSLDPNSPDERPLSVRFKRVRLDSEARR